MEYAHSKKVEKINKEKYWFKEDCKENKNNEGKQSKNTKEIIAYREYTPQKIWWLKYIQSFY